MGHGIELIAQYTYSKTLTDNLGYYGCGGVASDGAYWQDAYNRHGNYGPACFDARQNFTTGGAYTLPFGKGQKFGGSANKIADAVFGGWNLNYFVSRHTGFPVSINAGSANTGGRTPRGNVRANYYVPFSNTGTQTVDTWFGKVYTSSDFCAAGVNNGTCNFGIPATGSLGNSGVGILRAPGFFNMDTSIGKKFRVTEKNYFDFRAEFFNLFNHVSWGPPGRDITSPASFGAITSQITTPRNIQFGLKYHF
jgi:hypothetical protein